MILDTYKLSYEELNNMKYRVFYNEDCQKYGVQKQITDYMGTRWTQIIIHNGKEVAPFHRDSKKGHCYTIYKAVAERWLRSLA